VGGPAVVRVGGIVAVVVGAGVVWVAMARDGAWFGGSVWQVDEGEEAQRFLGGFVDVGDVVLDGGDFPALQGVVEAGFAGAGGAGDDDAGAAFAVDAGLGFAEVESLE